MNATFTPVPWPVAGHDWAVQFLQKSLLHRRVRHAYLILGAQNIGKGTLAHAFAQTLQCEAEDEAARPCQQCGSCRRLRSGNHPDLLYTQNDEKTGALKIDAIRDITRLIALKPFSGRYRIAILDDFDGASPPAQDALLKTLEEPSPYAVLILLAQSTENILPTITSRCQIIRLRPASQQVVREVLLREGADPDQADLLARLSSGRIGWALQALHDEGVMADRQQALEQLEVAIAGSRAQRFALAEDLGKLSKPALRYILEIWQTYWRDLLLLVEGSPVKPCNSDRSRELERLSLGMQPADALRALRATRELLLRTLNTNANARLALEAMFLEYPQR